MNSRYYYYYIRRLVRDYTRRLGGRTHRFYEHAVRPFKAAWVSGLVAGAFVIWGTWEAWGLFGGLNRFGSNSVAELTGLALVGIVQASHQPMAGLSSPERRCAAWERIGAGLWTARWRHVVTSSASC